MAYARARQERYVKTAKGKAAINRSRKKEQNKLRSTSEGREKLRYRKIKSRYGEKIADWWWEQDPICFMCSDKVKYEKAPSRKNGRRNSAELVIDHNHSKKEFIPRGLLCQKHNLAYGMFNENIEELQRAIEYKRRYG